MIREQIDHSALPADLRFPSSNPTTTTNAGAIKRPISLIKKQNSAKSPKKAVTQEVMTNHHKMRLIKEQTDDFLSQRDAGSHQRIN